ncbi:MAG: GntR family transcriptional regulator [Candidatus Hydrogenedentes bacterium]|jgi:DNA-binding GntR family transcriptional regulator|nr:GntR family transcriptional regulator [Candidatus Hydrogenedentota bacterium]
MSDQTTAAEMASLLVRNEILGGGIKPNTKLKVQHLARQYGVGTTPLREALTQLAAAGLVIQTGQRGFRVPGLSHTGWMDLIRTREILETEALRLALENRSVDWEDSVISCFHLFVREIERLFRGETDSIQRYWFRHTEFHQALIAACPLENLKSLVSTLYTRMIPYRRLTFTDKYSKDRLIQAHEALMNDALSPSSSAIETMREHIRANADIITQVLSSVESAEHSADLG